MDKYEVKLESSSDGQKFRIYKNGNRWVEFGYKEEVEHLLTLLVLSTSSGEPLEIEDEVANIDYVNLHMNDNLKNRLETEYNQERNK